MISLPRAQQAARGGSGRPQQAGSPQSPTSTQGAGRRGTDATDLGDTCPRGTHCLRPLRRTSIHSPCSYLSICTDTQNLQVKECLFAVTAISLRTATSALSALSQWRAGDSLCLPRGRALGRSASSGMLNAAPL